MARVSAMRAASITVLTIAAVGCAYDAPPASPPTPSTEAIWQEDVYPLLLRDCGFPECHGDPGRFFRVYGPGRTRLSEEVLEEGQPVDRELFAQTAPIEALEMQLTYDRARSMLASSDTPEQSLLLRKPLAVGQGGAPHMGTDERGRDVYQTTGDDGYERLLRWARTGYRDE